MSKETALAYLKSTLESPSETNVPRGTTESVSEINVPRGTSSFSDAPVEPTLDHSDPTQAAELTPPKEELKSTPFSKLAKQERDFLEKREAFKKELEEFEKNKQKIIDANIKLEEFNIRKKTDPISALKDLGFNEADLVNFLAGEQKPELSAEDKIAQAASEAAEKKFKTLEEERTRRELEAQKKRDEELIQDYKKEISKKMDAESEAFPFCRFWGDDAKDLVYELTVKVLEESKGTKMLSVEEAFKMAESYFEEKSDAMIAIKTKKSPQAPVADSPTNPTAQALTRTQTTRPGYPNAPQPKATLQGNRLSRTLGSQAASSVSHAKPVNESYEQKRARIIAGLRDGKF